MHRIISARNLSQNSVKYGLPLPSSFSFRNKTTVQLKCQFCRKVLLASHVPEKLLAVRHQSTRTANAVKSQKKKARNKNYKKYGELLAVNDSSMKEMKVSISKFSASQLSKLASSSVSLGQLHQLSTTPKTSNIEVDKELLNSVREKILRKSPVVTKHDEKCALVFTNHKIATIEEKLKTKQIIDSIKESYYSFRKATLYDQRLQDLQYAINEGVNQEFDLNSNFNPNLSTSHTTATKSPHAIFRELFIDNNNLDSFDHDFMNNLSNLQMQGLVHPSIDCDDPGMHGEIDEVNPLLDENSKESELKTLNIKKAKQAIKAKKKKIREKRRVVQEKSMKQDMRDLERRGKQEGLERLLASHLHLLCSLDMAAEGRQVLQYYRQKRSRVPDHPKIEDVRIFNTLLHGFASKGQLESTEELLSFMSEDGIQPNAQSYAAIFECVERSDVEDKISVLNNYYSEMQEKGITLNDIFDKSKFLYDQREVILQAVQHIEPNFEPVYTLPILDYDCPLLENLKLSNKENRLGLLHSPAQGLMTVEDLYNKGKEQLEMEMSGEIQVQNVSVKGEESETVKAYRQTLKDTEESWRDKVREAFVRNLGTLRSRSSASHTPVSLYPYLKVLEVEEYVDLMLNEVTKLVDGSESFSPTLKLLQRELGTQVYHKYQMQQYKTNGYLTKLDAVYKQYCRWYLERHPLDDDGTPLNNRQAWQTIVHRNSWGASLDVEDKPWPLEMRQNIGKFLYNIIINDIKINVNMFKPKAKEKLLPAVYKVHRPWGRLVRLELKPHPTLTRLAAAAARPVLRLRAALAPTRAPPAPWHSATAPGAYLLTDTPLVRMPFFITSGTRRLEEAPPAQLYPALDSLNQLGEVPWVINTRVLDLQMQVFRAGGDKNLDIPPPASSLDASSFGPASDAASAHRRRAAMSRARAEMHSLWCDTLYKLSLANHYRDATFWLPHNMDFRGRVYAVGPHVSALGADAARALLRLAYTRPLGPRGLRWLKLHAINLTGAKKRATLDERLEYADSIMDQILDSADRPLNGAGWWRESEEPWQTLACCMEIANAVRSPNPEEYMCGFPVHQDGSCNGLQHYAALGGDAGGAAAVNLAPAPRPQDVYSEVAALVETMRARDAAAGVPQAKVLEGFVRRKVIKQTVMTTVYGVTRFGARLQIAKQLKDISEFPKDQVWSCSQYLTAKTFDSLREMFTSTKLIQDWFTDCAKLISSVCGESVEWVTPLGLPVLQPYYRRASNTRTPLDLTQRPCTMKQRNAFPPNFIHSLDSSHMMLTALACAAAPRPLAFVSVHDCYWTHPDTVDVMNRICREQFVALHSQPILEDLSKFMVEKYSYPESEIIEYTTGVANKKRVNSVLQKVPEKGTFDIKSVLDSVYFFS
ncbi:DNA-directed RNA polymerase, mitochondrial [Aricia agestis]|uniref:DNA-directed RNA polymerase, mitochondrial n=1 Tax=Aricia agestis TaxID=91739 RepID=UPI001C203303|nr:DNA-directed RNA polymerase, mitochondrial [Aricia agestis]